MSEKTKAQLLAELKATKEALKGAQNEAEAYKEVVERVSSDLLNQGAELKKVKIELEEAKRGNKGLWQENQDLTEGIRLIQNQLEGKNTIITMLKEGIQKNQDAKNRAIQDADRWEKRYNEKGVWDCVKDWWYSL